MKNLTELSTRNSPLHLLKVKRNIWHNLVKPDPIKQLSDGELNDIFMLHYFLSSFSIFFRSSTKNKMPNNLNMNELFTFVVL